LIGNRKSGSGMSSRVILASIAAIWLLLLQGKGHAQAHLSFA
jgi:hypothetical protein